MFKKHQFKSTCKRCDTEEEFEYIGLIGSEHQCLRCGEILINEKSRIESITEQIIYT